MAYFKGRNKNPHFEIMEENTWRFWFSNDISRNFWIFSIIYAANNAFATTPLLFATSAIDPRVAGVSVGTYCICFILSALFLAPLLLNLMRPRQVLTCCMFTMSLSVGVFFNLATVFEGNSSAQWSCAMANGVAGGTAGAVGWTAWGVYLASSCDELASLSADPHSRREESTATLSAGFATIFLIMEVACSLTAAALFYIGLDRWIVFMSFGLIALAMTLLMSSIDDIEDRVTTRKEGVGCIDKLFSKALRAVVLWKDPKLWLLGLTSLTFGLSAALMNANTNPAVAEVYGLYRVGFMTATTSLVASIVSFLLRFLTSRSMLRRTLGLTVGAFGFLVVSLGVSITRMYGPLTEMEHALVLLYVGQGIGRGVYEGINKALFADHYPTNKEGAFANQTLIVALPYGVVFFFRKGTTVHDWHVAIAVLVYALLIVPAYKLAIYLERTSRTERTYESKEYAQGADVYGVESDSLEGKNVAEAL